ncbi:glycosyltransferase family 2 protein [Paenibacillus tritici]|uniref:Glycosyltransferase family 2 protein n=1 Tax=Paenibacillus tritici TaxID=1873425 RepID=A0ABX2DJG7_9BACL|nr:glycosyltransferase [Paenibacillus tritici]NQX44620.1 glycosyltransferase family 2 protein [Paenibacillus tritici]
MKNNHKTTIIVPVFNGEAYIETCLECLINQSYNNLEIIVVDDGSTDNTKKYIELYMEKDSRVLLVEQKNQGVSSARNKGLSYCTGEYVCFVDCDDTIDRDYCKIMIGYMNENIDAVVCGVRVSYNGEFTEDSPYYSTVSGEAACLNILEQRNVSGFIWNKLFRTSVFQLREICFPEGLIYEDLLVCYEYFRSVHSVQYIAEALYHYKRRSGSLCTNYDNPRRMSDLIEIIKIMEEKTLKNQMNLKAFIFFLHNSLLRLNNYFIRSNYIGNDILFKKCARFIIERIQVLNGELENVKIKY